MLSAVWSSKLAKGFDSNVERETDLYTAYFDKHINNHYITWRFEEDNSAIYRGPPSDRTDAAWDELYKCLKSCIHK